MPLALRIEIQWFQFGDLNLNLLPIVSTQKPIFARHYEQTIMFCNPPLASF